MYIIMGCRCDFVGESREEVLDHLQQANHLYISQTDSFFSDDGYLIPVIPNDHMLTTVVSQMVSDDFD